MLVVFTIIALLGIGSQLAGLPTAHRDPLTYSDLVVKAVLEDVTLETRDATDFSPTLDGRMTIAVLHLSVNDVWRGQCEEDQIRVYAAFAGSKDLETGQELVVCARYNRHFPNGGTYVVQSDGLLVNYRDRWYRLHEGLTLPLVQAKVRLSRPEMIVQRSDLIVVGYVTSERTKTDVVPVRMTVTIWTMNVTDILKGTVETDQFEFRMVTGGITEPSWRAPVQSNLHQDHKWLIFLKNTEVGYVPFAGTNGIIVVDGERLKYSSGRPFPHSLRELKDVIALE